MCSFDFIYLPRFIFLKGKCNTFDVEVHVFILLRCLIERAAQFVEKQIKSQQKKAQEENLKSQQCK